MVSNAPLVPTPHGCTQSTQHTLLIHVFPAHGGLLRRDVLLVATLLLKLLGVLGALEPTLAIALDHLGEPSLPLLVPPFM